MLSFSFSDLIDGKIPTQTSKLPTAAYLSVVAVGNYQFSCSEQQEAKIWQITSTNKPWDHHTVVVDLCLTTPQTTVSLTFIGPHQFPTSTGYHSQVDSICFGERKSFFFFLLFNLPLRQKCKKKTHLNLISTTHQSMLVFLSLLVRAIPHNALEAFSQSLINHVCQGRRDGVT